MARNELVGHGARPDVEHTDLDIPDRHWVRPLAWLSGLVGVQYVALGLAMGLHPAGFDDCEATASSGAAALMTVIAGVTVAGSAALVLWRLRGLLLLAGLALVTISALAWWVLLGTTQNC